MLLHYFKLFGFQELFRQQVFAEFEELSDSIDQLEKSVSEYCVPYYGLNKELIYWLPN